MTTTKEFEDMTFAEKVDKVREELSADTFREFNNMKEAEHDLRTAQRILGEATREQRYFEEALADGDDLSRWGIAVDEEREEQ